MFRAASIGAVGEVIANIEAVTPDFPLLVDKNSKTKITAPIIQKILGMIMK